MEDQKNSATTANSDATKTLCPHCQKLNRETANFCGQCGKKINETCPCCWKNSKQPYNCRQSNCQVLS